MIRFNSITKDDAYIELSNDEGKTLLPTNSVIFVEDESDDVSVKLTGSRQTIGLIPKSVFE